jgi:hypothetical protein
VTDGLADSPGKLDGGKKPSRIQIIFARLVDYSDLVVFRGVCVG